MTREEAIEILEEVKMLDDSIYQYNEMYFQALGMAINALEQDPAIKYFNTIYELSQTLGVSYDFIDEKIKEAAKTLKALPQEPCNDCISRQALLDDVTRFMDAFYGENGKMMYSDHILNEADCNDLKEWIKSFPRVTPTDEKCQECKKDWTKCSRCPVTMEWVKEQKGARNEK